MIIDKNRPMPTRESAVPADRDAVAQLLTATGLDASDLSTHLGGFLVVRDRGRVVACACLEDHGRVGLLRSVATDHAYRSRGLARALVGDLLARARARGHRTVYLLTTGAAGYFARFGFRAVDRGQVAPEALASPQFWAAACASATVMALNLGASALHSHTSNEEDT